MIVFFIILRNQQTLLTFLHEKCLFFMHVWILAHPYIYCKLRLSFHNQKEEEQQKGICLRRCLKIFAHVTF